MRTKKIMIFFNAAAFMLCLPVGELHCNDEKKNPYEKQKIMIFFNAAVFIFCISVGGYVGLRCR